MDLNATLAVCSKPYRGDLGEETPNDLGTLYQLPGAAISGSGINKPSSGHLCLKFGRCRPVFSTPVQDLDQDSLLTPEAANPVSVGMLSVWQILSTGNPLISSTPLSTTCSRCLAFRKCSTGFCWVGSLGTMRAPLSRTSGKLSRMLSQRRHYRPLNLGHCLKPFELCILLVFKTGRPSSSVKVLEHGTRNRYTRRWLGCLSQLFNYRLMFSIHRLTAQIIIGTRTKLND